MKLCTHIANKLKRQYLLLHCHGNHLGSRSLFTLIQFLIFFLYPTQPTTVSRFGNKEKTITVHKGRTIIFLRGRGEVRRWAIIIWGMKLFSLTFSFRWTNYFGFFLPMAPCLASMIFFQQFLLCRNVFFRISPPPPLKVAIWVQSKMIGAEVVTIAT